MKSLLHFHEFICVASKKRKVVTTATMMEDYPVERIGYRQPPFNNCGFQIFGSKFVIPFNEIRETGFFLVCIMTRAVHNQTVSSRGCIYYVKTSERFVLRLRT